MRKQTILAILCVGLGLALFAGGVWASSVTLRVGSVQAVPGGAADVPIQVQGASNIGAIQMVLVYDAAVLTPETVTRGPLAGSNALLDSNTQTPGRLALGLVTLDGLQGDGTLATVRFKVLGSAGQSSQLTLEKVEAWEKTSYAPVLVTTEPGQVTVGGGPSLGLLALLAVCGCGVLLLVLALVAGLVMLRARRQPAAAPYAAPPTPPAYGYPPSQPYGYPPAPPARSRTIPILLIGCLGVLVLLGVGAVALGAVLWLMPPGGPVASAPPAQPTWAAPPVPTVPPAQPTFAPPTPTLPAPPTWTVPPAPTAPPAPTVPPAQPTPAPTQPLVQPGAPAVPAGWRLVLADTFDSNANQWPTGSQTNDYVTNEWRIADGKYRWQATAHQGFSWYVYPKNLPPVSDFYLTVDVRQVSGPDSADFGVALRVQDNTNYYRFGIVNAGKYYFVRLHQGQWDTLRDWISTTAIRPGQVNRITVLAQGSHFACYINDQLVTETDDSLVAKGQAGLNIGFIVLNTPAVFEFDNFELRAP